MLAQQASKYEACSLESASSHQDDVPAPFQDDPNQWCVDGQYLVYRDTKVLNEKGMMTRLVTVEQRLLTGSLHTVPDVHRLFTHHKLDWMARSLGRIARILFKSYTPHL